MRSRTKILITGGSGLLATNIACLKKNDWNIHLLLHRKDVQISGVETAFVSLSQADAFRTLLAEINPDVIIHTAGLTNVDKCETDYRQAEYSNVYLTEIVAKASADLNVKLVHISTDHFSNSSKSLSDESEIEVPLNNYAKTKLDAEYVVQKYAKESIIVRTNFFGWGHQYRQSFSDRILSAARAGKEISLPDDVFFTPILIADLINAIDRLLSAKKTGIYNVVGPERISKYDFGVRLLKSFSLNPELVKKSSYQAKPGSAVRPKDMSLSSAKLCRDINIRIPDLNTSFQTLKAQESEGIAEALRSSVKISLQKNPINYGRQSISEKDIDAVVTTLRSEALTQGPKVLEFEEAIASYVGAKYAVAVNNLTSGMHIAGMTVGLSKGDHLITSPISFVASSNCAIYCGATPLFADIDPDTLNLTPENVEQLCKTYPNVKAIVPVHFAGAPCNMNEIKEIADKYGCVVIEDAAHALGGRYHSGQMIGSSTQSSITGFSFHPVKSITTGEGGALTTNDKEIYQQLCRLRSHGINKGQDPFVNLSLAYTDGTKNAWYYEMQQLGYNFRITDLQCALGLSQLKRVSDFHQRRVEVAVKYDEAFSGLKNAKTVQSSSRRISGNHLYILLVDFKKLGTSKNELFTQFKNEFNIGLHVHYMPIPMNPYYQKNFNIPDESIKNAVEYYHQAVTLPLYPAMENEDVDRVIHAVSKLIG